MKWIRRMLSAMKLRKARRAEEKEGALMLKEFCAMIQENRESWK